MYNCPLLSARRRLVVEVGLVSLVGVVLVHITVVLVVHALGLALSVSLGLLSVIHVHALGLSQTVDFTTNDTGQQLLGESVLNWLA